MPLRTRSLLAVRGTLCALMMAPCARLQNAGVSCVACRLRRELPRAGSPMQHAARASVPHRAADRCAVHAELCFHAAACQQATAATPHAYICPGCSAGSLRIAGDLGATLCLLVSCVARAACEMQQRSNMALQTACQSVGIRGTAGCPLALSMHGSCGGAKLLVCGPCSRAAAKLPSRVHVAQTQHHHADMLVAPAQLRCS